MNDQRERIAADERDLGLGAIRKTLASAIIAARDNTSFAQRVLDEHKKLALEETW